MGRQPRAYLVCGCGAGEGAMIEEKELRAHCREHLANYKIPKYFDIVADLPRTPTGKVLKRMLSAKA